MTAVIQRQEVGNRIILLLKYLQKKKKNNKTSVPMKGYSIISRHSWISCKCALQILAQPLKKVKKKNV